MLGQLIKSGKGMCDIIIDEEKLLRELDDIGETEEDYIEVTENNIDTLLQEEEDEDCMDDDFKFSIE